MDREVFFHRLTSMASCVAVQSNCRQTPSGRCRSGGNSTSQRNIVAYPSPARLPSKTHDASSRLVDGLSVIQRKPHRLRFKHLRLGALPATTLLGGSSGQFSDRCLIQLTKTGFHFAPVRPCWKKHQQAALRVRCINATVPAERNKDEPPQGKSGQRGSMDSAPSTSLGRCAG